MEKLEKIMHAEESARQRVTDAREQAIRLVREATDSASGIRAGADEKAATEALERTAATLSEFAGRAEEMRGEARNDLERTLQQAEARKERALAAVAAEFVE